MVLLCCNKQEKNPFLNEFQTPFRVPPFDIIKIKDYVPAFEEGMRLQKMEIEAITGSQDEPTFQNTLEALEASGAVLHRVSSVFNNLTSAHTNVELQRIEKEVAPLLSKHNDDILMDEELFRRVETLHQRKDQLGLDREGERLLVVWFRDFVRGGAELDDEGKSKLRGINEELSILSVRFAENVLKETNTFALVIDSESDLAGLPASVAAAGAQAAADRGYQDKWVFTLQKPSMIPFLQYARNRDLRKKLFTAYTLRGDNGNDNDNNQIVSRIASLRSAKAQLLGYETYADYVLEENMASNPKSVYALLERLWSPALKAARAEAELLQEIIADEGDDFSLQPWDWWYYAEKVRRDEYDLDDAELRPYFQLDRVREGAFDLAKRLYGVTIEERSDLPVYHPEVRSFVVTEKDGNHLGVLYLDYFPRESKKGGAWMNAYRKQSVREGRPVISNVCNFSRPTSTTPALLSFEEVSTLFHEFGHALHGLLSDCTYRKLSGTDVPRDFVELPSQIMENWASEPELLRSYAKHYLTGDVIPEDLIQKLQKAAKFNKGFEAVEYLAAAYLDLSWHGLAGGRQVETRGFEEETLERIGLIPEIVTRYRSTYFSHIFSGSYPAGYYSYYWAEVLDADAFQTFKEEGLFDQATAQSFRENILARGATEDPMALYLRFKGNEPRIEPLLERKGLM